MDNPDSPPAPDSVWPLFATVQAVLFEAMEARLSQAGLPPLAWYDVLWALERAEGGRMRISDLADHTVLSRSNATRLVDRLEAAGLVRRARTKEDGRGAYAVLTPAGARQRQAMWPTYEAAIAELFDRHLKPAEANAIRTGLRRVLAAARAGEAGAGQSGN